MKDCIQVDRIIGLDGNGSLPVSIVIDESGFISGVDTQKISEIWFEGELLTQ